MRPIARRNIEAFCRRIAARRAEDYECELLFVVLREEFPVRWPPTPAMPQGKPSVLRDLGNALAHERRDRGFISDYLHDFADRWLAEAQKEGERSIDIEPIYPVEDLYQELFAVLSELNIEHDAEAMLAAEYHMVTRIGWALDRREVRYDKRDPEDYCVFVGDIGVDSRIAQPACWFNTLRIPLEDWGDEDEPTLFGTPSGRHQHFAVPLLKDYVSEMPSLE